MIKYKFYKSKPSDREYYLLSVEKPYDYLGYFTIGHSWNSDEIQKLIDGIKKVKNKEEDDFFFRTQSGFLADMDTEDDGVYIFDEFSKDPTKELFIIPFDDVIKLLEDFKEFIEKEV